jgi:tetratricopeptide (TPR) repeat protein
LNIWAWVRDTKDRLRRGDPQAQRLAELMHELPSAAVDEAHERVDGMVPEALALARDLDEPWVELFIRHWNLQSRVLHRRRAGDELREAVSLLDFSSGQKTRGCPQSVCAVQDLAVCYAIRDGPGYVPERLAVARETLERIDPGWACFDCICGEYFSALMDDGRAEDALAFLDEQIARAAEHGQFELGFNTTLNRARALAELGRAERALALVDGIGDARRFGRSRAMTLRQARVAILLKLGRVEQGLALHPPLSAVIDTGGHLREWVENLVTLVEAGAIANTARVGRELHVVWQRFVEHCAYWDAARTALMAARLAAARRARELTRMSLADYTQVVGELRRPERLAELREAVEADLAALDALADAAEPPLEEGEQEDPEGALDRLARLRAGEAGGDDAGLALEYAARLRELGRAKQARALLEQRVAAEGGAEGRVLVELAATLLASHDHAELDQLLERADAGEPSSVTWLQLRWIRGQSLRARKQLDRVIELDRETLAVTPEATFVQLRLATTARELGDWEVALEALDAAAAVMAPGDIDWDRMTAATALGRWGRVRAAARRLEFEVPGEGDEPIELDLGVVRCEFVEASGRRERYWARRTSPCGAQIVEIAMPGDPQHFGDQVVFEPSDLDGHLREEGRPHRPTFEVVAITRAGDHRAFLLRGFDPGREAFEELRSQLQVRGWGVERITAEGRSAKDPRVGPEADDAPEVPTLAVLVAIPRTIQPAQLRQAMRAATKDWELPLLDPALDEAAGDPRAAEQASDLLARWKP